MSKEKKNLISVFVAVLVLLGGLVSVGYNVSAREAESGGGSSSGSSSVSDDSSDDDSSSSSSKSSKNSTTKKVEDKASTGTFSTPTDSRRGATKPEDDGIDASQGIDDRNGAN
ncbi:MAG: hypothetical protein ACD_8C00084G0004, partial [uncultured bacterium]